MLREQRDEVEEGGKEREVRVKGELVSFDSRASHANFFQRQKETGPCCQFFNVLKNEL